MNILPTPRDHDEFAHDIHPINVQYLMKTLPHRLYADMWGATLELTADSIAQNIIETLHAHGCIIGMRYCDGTDSFIQTYIFTTQGAIYIPNGKNGFIRWAIEYDLLYMLLNPLNINNWILQERKDIPELRKNTESNPRDHLPVHAELRNSIDQTRERYTRLMFQGRK